MGFWGSLTGSDAAEKASRAYGKASKKAVKLQKEIYHQTRADMEPYRLTGYEALKDLKGVNLNLPENFQFEMDTGSDSYRWKQEQGEEAINRALAARGLYGSRAGLDTLSDFNRSLAADEYTDQYNRALQGYNLDYGKAMDLYNAKYGQISDLLNVGLGGQASVNAARQNMAQGIQNAYMQRADAQAQAALAANQGFQNLFGNALQAGLGAGAMYAMWPRGGWSYSTDRLHTIRGYHD